MKKQISVIVVLIILAVVFSASAFLQEKFNEAVDALEEVFAKRKIVGIIIFAGLAALSAMLSPFSSVPLVPVAVVIWGNAMTTALLVVGWTLGGIITYAIGKWAFYPLLTSFVLHEKIEYYRNKLTNHTDFWLVLIFRLALPSEIPGYLLGIIRYHFGKYILATFLSELLFVVITVYASEAFIARDPLLFGLIIIGEVILVAIFLKMLHRRLK